MGSNFVPVKNPIGLNNKNQKVNLLLHSEKFTIKFIQLLKSQYKYIWPMINQ